MRAHLTLSVAFALSSFLPLEAALRAGAATADVSPTEFPVNMPGGFSANQADKVHDPLMARALVLDDGSTTVALVVVDNLGLPAKVNAEAKALAARRTGIPEDKIMISATHSHSAVGAPAEASDAANLSPEARRAQNYRARMIGGIADAIAAAHANLRPAQAGFGSAALTREVFNRRWYLQPGKMKPNPFGEMDRVKMNPENSPAVLDRPAGPTDPELGVLSVLDAKRKPLALFANYSLHYVGATPKGEVSADYYGEFARLVPFRLNAPEGFVAMMSNGTSGDINNIPFGGTRPPRAPFEQVRIVAGEAADAAWEAQKAIPRHRADCSLGMRQRVITLQYRKPTKEQVLNAKAVLAIKDAATKATLPALAEPYARRTLALAEQPEITIDVVVQAVRIGDGVICCIPFETFAETGLELKKKSPFARTMVVGLANGRHGYLPTPAQHELGGYETWLGTNVVQKDASEIIVRNLEEMMRELMTK